MNLKERISSYEEISNHKLLNGVPIIIEVNGRNFKKITSMIEKPFDQELANCFATTMLQLSMEIDSCIFSYHYNDEVVFVLYNENYNWCDNRVQKISSLTSSIFTSVFSKHLSVDLLQDPIFYTKCFVVPNLNEAASVILSKQIKNFYITVQNICIANLSDIYSEEQIKQMLVSLSKEDRIKFIKNYLELDYYDFEKEFINGIACYRHIKDDKKRWKIDTNFPHLGNDINKIIKLFDY